ncbi:MAG: EutN/CcmL family microcompartment protein [Acidimicrobiia bacterium]|nr:EutN/CcmL family microcompartment protein [Acidimicrobiia bacterium]
MRIARVIGTATGPIKDPPLSGHTLLVIEPVDAHGKANGPHEVATDAAIGAGVGDWVLVATGSAARQPGPVRGIATDASIVMILEEIRLGAETTYHSLK